MPPKRVIKAKKVTKASKPQAALTAAQEKELEKLLKVQKEAEAAQEDAKKKGE
jgi:hypothetical protein